MGGWVGDLPYFRAMEKASMKPIRHSGMAVIEWVGG